MKLCYLVYFLILFNDVITKHKQYHHKHKKKAKIQKQKSKKRNIFAKLLGRIEVFHLSSRPEVFCKKRGLQLY